MAINERVITGTTAAAGNGGGAGSGNQEEGLILHLDANDVDSFDGAGDDSVWYDIKDHEYTPTTNVSEHFNTIIWDGDGSTNRDINGVGFAPDLVWIKRYAPNYGGNRDHRAFDTLRGAGKVIYPSGAYSEATPTNELNGFLDDGFNVGNSDAVNANIYGVEKYVAWCFKAGGAAVSNTDGTITSQVSANNDLGFSIVEYTGTGSNATIGHGLDSAPELIFIKRTDASSSWSVYTPLGPNYYMFLNSTDAAYSGSSLWWNNTAPTPSVFSTGSYGVHNTVNSTNIAYCFASKRGVSKVGSYTGTGAAGNKVYTGFEPAWIMIKATNAVQDWFIVDNKTSTSSGEFNKYLEANSTDHTATPGANINIHRDGFSFDGVSFNNSNTNFIYLAFAKDTNETDLIPDTDLELHLDADSFDGSTNTPSTWTALTGSNATISGATFDSELGNYLNFDGSNDYVSIPSSSTTPIDFTSKSYSIECWVNIDSNTIHPILAKYGTTDSLRSTNFSIRSSRNLSLYERISSSGHTSLSTSALSLNTWHHVCVVRKSSQVEFYIDGELDNTVSATGTPNSGGAQNINIGSQANGNYSFLNGKIGQLRAYSSTLTQDQIRQNFNFTKPSYPNGNDGTISGATWNSGGYFDFNGSSDYIDLSNNPSFPTTTSQTNNVKAISAWIKPDTTSSNFYIFSVSSTTQTKDYFSFDWIQSVWSNVPDLRVRVQNGGSSNRLDAIVNNVSTDQWVHVVAQLTTEVEMYVNGVKQTVIFNKTGAATDSYWIKDITYATAVDYLVGQYRSVNATNSDGLMSKLKVYDRALTQAEITALHSEGE